MPVRPDAGPHVAGARREVPAGWAGRYREDQVLVPLQHELRVARPRVPELNLSIFRAR